MRRTTAATDAAANDAGAETPHAIEIHLDQLLAARGMTLTELSHRIGITLANASILKTGKTRAIRLSTLTALCRELQCQPGDLLSYRPPTDPGSEATGPYPPSQ